MDDFLLTWPDRLHGAVVEALEYLVRHDASPTSDGILGDFVERLEAMKFQPQDAAHVARLLEKPDPHLVEVGVQLAASVLRDGGDWDALEAPMERMISRAPLDAWIALRLLALLGRYGGPASVYVALAARHGQRPDGRGPGIHRNRFIDPWRDLEAHYAQLIIQVLEPGPRERAILPILERRHGTRGFPETQAKILRDMGFDPAEHRKLLARRP